MFELLKFPNEIIHEVLQQVESFDDILNISLVNKLLHDLCQPHLFRWATIVMYMYSSECDIARGFAKLADQWILHLQHIEFVESTELFRQKLSRKYLKIPVINRHVYPEGYKANVENTNLMRSHLRELILRIKPGQLRSIIFEKVLHRRQGSSVELKVNLVNALFTTQNLLTQLEFTVDVDIATEPCNIFYLPHLQHLRYVACDYVGPHHVIFSLLHSCQDTLLELHTGYTRRYSDVTTTGDTWEHKELVMGYDAWEKCEMCCLPGTSEVQRKRIRLKKLRAYSLSDDLNGGMAKLLSRKELMKDALVKSVNYGRVDWHPLPLSFSSEGSVNIHSLFSYPRGRPSTQDEFESYFLSAAGLTVAAYYYPYKGLGSDTTVDIHPGSKIKWGWLDALHKNHSHSLTELSVSGSDLSEQQLERIGRALPNLEKVTVCLEESIWMPEAALDKTIFPALKTFSNETIPGGKRPGLTRTIRKQVLNALTKDRLPEKLRLLDMCTRKYIIERNIAGTSQIESHPGGSFARIDTAVTPNLEECLQKYHLRVCELPLSGKSRFLMLEN